MHDDTYTMLVPLMKHILRGSFSCLVNFYDIRILGVKMAPIAQHAVFSDVAALSSFIAATQDVISQVQNFT